MTPEEIRARLAQIDIEDEKLEEDYHRRKNALREEYSTLYQQLYPNGK